MFLLSAAPQGLVETGLRSASSVAHAEEQGHLSHLKRAVPRLLWSAERKISAKGRADPPLALLPEFAVLRCLWAAEPACPNTQPVLATNTSIVFRPRGPPHAIS